MFRLSLVSLAVLATVSFFAVQAENERQPGRETETEITFSDDEVEVITIEVDVYGGHTVTRDHVENVIEVYNKTTDTSSTTITFRDDEALHIQG